MDSSRISTCSIAVIDQPPNMAFNTIRAAGYKKVDVLERVPHFSLFPGEVDYEAIKVAANVNGVKIANLATYPGGGADGRSVAWAWHGWTVSEPDKFTSFGFSSDTLVEQDKELEQLIRTIDLAVLLGARSIRVVPGNDQPDTIDKIVPWFKRAAEYAEEKKIYMGIEAEAAGSISGTPELIRELVDKVGSPYLGVLFEPGNLMNICGVDYRHALEVMKDIVVHTHFKDCKVIGDKHEFVMMGEGDIDFKWIVEQLEATGYKGDYSLEYELHDPSPAIGLRMFYDKFVGMFDSN
ncbi:sugar phosphate isomerase/epimerase family protein [Thermoproteota archaeon]